MSDEKSALDFNYGQHASPPVQTPSVADDLPGPQSEEAKKVRHDIEHAAPENTALLKEIAETMEAVQALQNNEARLAYLEKELTAQSKSAREASQATNERLDRYTKVRDSFTRKWYYILTNMRQNREDKIKKGEELYHEALAAQSKAEQRETKLKQDKEAIEHENEDLGKDAKRHGEAHEHIDELYSKIFDGPTPGFPDEDERETNFRKNKDEHDATTKTLKAITMALKQFSLVNTTIKRAQNENARAKYELETSLFDGTEYALVFLDRCARLIDQAIKANQDALEGLLRPLDRDFLSAHQALSNHLAKARADAATPLGNGYPYVSSSEVFKAIQGVLDETTLASETVAVVGKMMKTYESTAKQAVRITSRALEDSRQALQEVRQNAFEITVGHGAAAPAYHECCDRADYFEGDANAQCERMPDPIIDDSGLPPPPSYDRVAGQNGGEPPQQGS